MKRSNLDGQLTQITKLLEEAVEDNTALVAELRRIDRSQHDLAADGARALAELRADLAGSLAYHALKDLCRELIGPLNAIDAMLEGANLDDPASLVRHVRSLAVTLRGVLARMGAEQVPVAVGQDRYDPVRHRCVGVVDPARSPFPTAAPHTVVRVVEHGYQLGQRPLSPVRVEIQADRPASND